jgi:hypothetical protein
MPLHDQMFPSNSLKTCVPVSNANVGQWCFNATFNNISVISWQSVLMVEETGENKQVKHKQHKYNNLNTYILPSYNI